MRTVLHRLFSGSMAVGCYVLACENALCGNRWTALGLLMVAAVCDLWRRM